MKHGRFPGPFLYEFLPLERFYARSIENDQAGGCAPFLSATRIGLGKVKRPTRWWWKRYGLYRQVVRTFWAFYTTPLLFKKHCTHRRSSLRQRRWQTCIFLELRSMSRIRCRLTSSHAKHRLWAIHARTVACSRTAAAWSSSCRRGMMWSENTKGQGVWWIYTCSVLLCFRTPPGTSVHSSIFQVSLDHHCRVRRSFKRFPIVSVNP